MIKRNVTVVNKSGIHARPASVFVNAAKKFTSKIGMYKVGNEDTVCNAKSIIMLLSMGFNKGTEVVVTADGPDEDEAVAVLTALIESGCGEED